MKIPTTEEYKSQTLCNHKKDLFFKLKGEFRTPLFLYLNNNDEEKSKDYQINKQIF